MTIPKDFDWEYYVESYRDLQKSGINTKQKAMWHYLNFGKNENRKYKKESSILQSYPNVLDTYNLNYKYSISISILLYYPDEVSFSFLDHAPAILISQLIDMKIKNINLIIRNNSLNHNSSLVIKQIKKLQTKYKKYKEKINFIYKENHNLGFGSGHNENFKLVDSDFFLCLNDDLGIPHSTWLNTAFKLFDTNASIGIIGSSQSPQFIDGELALGTSRNINFKTEPDYSEGSILFCRSELFNKLNGFDPIFKYFYFEDVDLCLRAKQIGYKQMNIDIPHQHFRSNSAQKISNTTRISIWESNRTKFLNRWGHFLTSNKTNFTNNILISLKSDGIGDLIDCFYPVQSLIDQHKLSNIFLHIANSKIKCIYDIFNIEYVDTIENKNYDIIYNIDDLNYAPPFHTLDILASKLNVENFNSNESKIKSFINYFDCELSIPDKKYVVLHFDCQRPNFDSRMPPLNKLIDSINYLSTKYHLILIGQKFKKNDTNYNHDYEKNILDLINKKLIYDYRDIGSIKNMFSLINNASLFFGIDSAPAHMSQLLNIPAYIIYGPINAITKTYRYDNTGCYYNLNENSESGSYHKNLNPTYHFDIRRDSECINVDSEKLLDSLKNFIKNKFVFNWIPIFNDLRKHQREFLNLQINSPIYKNKIFSDNVCDSITKYNVILKTLDIYENYAINTINKNNCQ